MALVLTDFNIDSLSVYEYITFCRNASNQQNIVFVQRPVVDHAIHRLYIFMGTSVVVFRKKRRKKH